MARCRRGFVAQRGVSKTHIHRDTQRANNEAGRQKNKADCHSYFLTDPQPGEKGGNAGDGTKAGPVLGSDWPGTPAAWETGRSGSERKPGGETASGDAAIPFGEHAAGEAEISAQEPTVVGRFHGQAVLQCRIVDRTSAEIDRASTRARKSVEQGKCGAL